MRVSSNKPNTLKLHDNISDSSIHLYYRTPTTKEVAAYTNGMTKRKKNKIVNCTGECRQKYGKDILEGLRDGDFGVEKDGQVVVVSSTPGTSTYDPGWKEKFCNAAPDLVERLAMHAFEMTADTDDGIELTGDDNEDTKDPN